MVISGYLGSAAIAAVVLGFVRRAKARNPKIIYLCDPAMGDAGPGFYVSEDLRPLFGEGLVPLADIITPNQFELEHLAGRAPATLEEMAAAARALGPSAVVVTGVHLRDTPADWLQTLAIEPAVGFAVATPRLSCRLSGTSDLFTALFAAARLQAFRPGSRSAEPFPVSMPFSKKRSGGNPTRWRLLPPRSTYYARISSSWHRPFRQPRGTGTFRPRLFSNRHFEVKHSGN